MPELVEAPAGPTLVRTKLHPPLRRGEVARPRLLAALTRKPSPRLALLRAPAGAGKTTLLAEWAASPDEQRRFAFLALDAGDNDPIRFWSYVIEALRGLAPHIGGEAVDLLRVPGAGIEDAVLPVLINDLLALDESLVLALDDYHVIRAPAVHRGLTFLIERGPPTLEVAIASRSEPPLPLARLLARGELAAIDALGLRFSLEETEQLLNPVLGLDLEPADVAALWERTEGWAAGLYLAALSLRGRMSAHEFIAHFAGDDRHVVDYLGEEVLAELPEDLRGFLLRTAILERLTAPLCDAVLERRDSAQRLVELERANLLLVPLDERREWYRYHHLFADLLRLELERTAPSDLAALHRRASAWHRGEGLADDAIRHAVAAGDIAEAGELIATHYSPAVQGGQTATADRWLGSLPEEAVRADARLCFARVIVTMSLGGHGDADAWIEAMPGAGLPAPFRDGTTSIESGVAVLRCMRAMNTGHVSAGVRAAQLAAQLEADGAPWHAVAVNVEGGCRCWLGDFAGAEPVLNRGIALARATGVMPMPEVFALGHLAFIAGERGAWDRAEQLVGDALALAARSGLQEHWACSTAHSVRGCAPNLHAHEAVASLRRGTELALRGAGQLDIAHSLVALAGGERRAGDHHAARRALDKAREILAGCPDPGILPAMMRPVELSPPSPAAAPRPDAEPQELSERELAVLRLLPTGLSQREIGGELYVSLNTVKSHTRSIFRKLGVTTRDEAVQRARQIGLL
jgi:LuxR family maltose regulon positive regulatory protein